MSVLQRASAILAVSLLLVGPQVSEAQTSFEILAGTSWSDGVMSPAAAAGLRVGFPQGASLSIALGYSRWHVRDSISFCGITGECFPTQVRAGFDLLRTEGLLHLRLPPTSVLELVIGGFAGIRTHCGEGLCDWRRPLQVGPVIGLEFGPSVSGRQFFARVIGYGSVRRSAAAYIAESGAEKEYRPMVVQLAIGALVR